MGDYFRNLNTLDPLFHAIVLARLNEIQAGLGETPATLDHLTPADEVAILREYSVKLFKEYRTLRAAFLENMMVTGRSVGLKIHSN